MARLTGPYSVYVLWSDKAQRYYIGVSRDVSRRLKQHNAGVSRWTRGRGPWRLVWSRQFDDYHSALQYERRLKRQKGGRGFSRMLDFDVPSQSSPPDS